MLCSNCNKNVAVIFINKVEGDNKTVEGLCYNCAKNKGINPLEVLAKQANLSPQEIKDMSNQFDSFINDFSSDLMTNDNNNLDNLDNANNPLGGFSFENLINNMFSGNTTETMDNGNSNVKKKVKIERKVKDKKKKVLDSFGVNLNEKAANGELDAVIGRKTEIQRVIQILNRRSKNNPCLIGEPGVGKTAIAHGLAIKIVEKNVPAKLLNKEIYLLDMPSVVAGTQFRGQFEGRMKAIMEECKKLGNIVLVIDEVHSIVASR